MDSLAQLLNIFLHLHQHVNQLAADLGPWLYIVIFAIIFAETGLVVTPFLPGDSLLFVAGAIAAAGGGLDVHVLAIVLMAAAVLGNSVNYAIGRWLGKTFFRDQGSKWLNPAHLDKAHAFYERHGGKAVVISRFLPIVRTYVPFVAGMAAMSAKTYTAYNVAGGFLWVGLLLYAGYFFGNIPWIKGNLTAIILGIIIVSLLPLAFAYLKGRLART